MTKRTSWECLFLAAALPLALIRPASSEAQSDQRSFSMGMAYWPPSGSATPVQVIHRDLDLLLPSTDAILVQVPWCPGSQLSEVEWMSSVARESGKELVIAVDWLVGARHTVRCHERSPWTFSDQSAARAYQMAMARLAERHRPDYLILGVEVDYYAVADPEDFRSFLATYRMTRDEIREITPETKVGVSLQYEHMLRTVGTAGTLVPDMLRAFEDMSDFIGLAVYPFVAGLKPEELGIDYFSSVRDLAVPLVLSETAWPGIDRGVLGVAAGWFGFGTQSPYLRRILEASNELGAVLVLWAGMKDVQLSSLDSGTPPWAAAIGLWDSRGQPKEALTTWQAWLGRPKSEPRRSQLGSR